MRRTMGTVATALLLAAAALAQPAPPPVNGRLAGAMLLGEAVLAPADIPSDIPSSDRLRILGYLDRGPARDLERQIVASVERPGIDETARRIAIRLTAAGTPDEEAAAAEALLRDASNAPAAPFLYAYLASRYRMQFEQAPDDRPTLERLAKKYRTMVERVRNSDDALFRLLAADLDNRPALATGVTRHPRQYLPDT